MKKRVNICMDEKILKLLKQVKKTHNLSISNAIEHAVKKTFKNKKEMLKERMRHHQTKLMQYKDQIAHIEENEDEKRK